jgi:3-dehydroquinate dehydratase
MFCNFYVVINRKIANDATTTKAREKLSADLESLEFNRFLDACLTKLKNNQIILNPQSYTDKQAIYWIKDKFSLFVVFIVQIELSNEQKQEMWTIYLLLSLDVVS